MASSRRHQSHLVFTMLFNTDMCRFTNSRKYAEVSLFHYRTELFIHYKLTEPNPLIVSLLLRARIMHYAKYVISRANH